MPKIPKQPAPLTSIDAAKILNTTRAEIGGTYADQIPVAYAAGDVIDGRAINDNDALMRLRDIGNIMMQFQPLQNAFLSNLVNRIARVYISSRLYSNPWRRFKKGILEYGETIEEIFVSLAKPHQYHYPNNENNPFKRHDPDVRAAFHSMNFQKYYPTTVSNDDLRQAFLSWQGITDLISKIIEQVYTGANYDEFITMKYMIARAALNGNIFSVTIPEVDASNARSVTTTMVAQAKNLTYMSGMYNMAGVKTYTDPSDLYIILTTNVESIFDVEVLALSFNMDKATLIGNQVGVDGFGVVDSGRLAELFANDPYTVYTPFTEEEIAKLNSIAALMVDIEWFMIFDIFENMTEIYNPTDLYWNYFYHVWKTFSISPFANAVLYTTEAKTVTGVIVSPENATVKKGGMLQLTAEVTGTGFVSKFVNWTITGTEPVTSTINSQGQLTIAKDEANTTLTVTATSVDDASKSASATITVG